MITTELASLGFSEKEISVYLCILKHGRISPANVARITKINRSTVYFIAKDLIARGLITEDTSASTSVLLALPPEELITHIESQERELQLKKERAKQAILVLQAITQETRYTAPKVTFITQEQLNAYLHKRTPVWNESILKHGGCWWGFQDPTLLEHYGEWIKWYWEQANPTAISLKLFTNNTKAEQQTAAQGYSRRQIKLWDQSRFTGTQWIVGDYIVNIITIQEPHYLVEIKDSVMAENLREMFKSMWK
jgi:DNA-binding MarR family transcriptional regulator